jgi:hypothetical protein
MIAKSKSGIKYPVGKLNISYLPFDATAVNIIGDAKETDPVPTPEIIVLFGIRKMSCRKYGVMTHVDPLSIKTGSRPGFCWILKHRKISNSLSR